MALLPRNTSKSKSLHRDKYYRKVSRPPAFICGPLCRLSRSTLKCPASLTPPPASVVVKVFLALTGCGLSFEWLTESSRFGTLYIQLFPPQSSRALQVEHILIPAHGNRQQRTKYEDRLSSVRPRSRKSAGEHTPRGRYITRHTDTV